jgi:hypothetical protein
MRQNGSFVRNLHKKLGKKNYAKSFLWSYGGQSNMGLKMDPYVNRQFH